MPLTVADHGRPAEERWGKGCMHTDEAPASEGVVGGLVECVRTCVQACLPDCDARRVRACPSCSAACAATDDFCPACGVRVRRVGARRARGGGSAE